MFERSEVSRIIDEQILPKSFFEEEVRTGFHVSTERKKLWAVQLDLLLKFDRVCKDYDFQYFLVGGTLLGAIRHNGFIPWDDDLDVAMPRSDYEDLLRLNPFNPPYLLQTPYTDSYYAFSHSRLRNINTTSFNRIFAFQPMCHGVYIDIHPIDNWMIEDKESYDRINALNKENSTYMRLTNPLLDDANKERCRHWSKRNPIDVYEEIQSIAKQYNNRETGYKIRAVITFMSYESMVMRSEWYNGFRLCDFEGFQFPVPFEAEKMLCVRYGDWQKPPSNSEKGCWHHYIFDADVPYPIFMEKYRNEQIATIDR